MTTQFKFMLLEHGINTAPTGKSSRLRPIELRGPEDEGHSDLSKMSVSA
jgi:hypothetical protein